MRFVNCQSWKDQVLDFSDGLNVIKADNNTGKSVIFKCIKITCSPNYYSKRERAFLIRHGAEYAEVTYLFSDKSVAVVRIFPQRIIYFYTPNNETLPYTQQQDIPHAEIVEKLSVVVETDSGFMANVLDLDQSLLLVNSNSKSDSNLVKVLTEHQQLSRLRTLFIDKLPFYNQKLKDVTIIKDRLEVQKSNFKYVDTTAMKRGLQLTGIALPMLRELSEVYRDLNRIEIDEILYDYNDLLSIIDTGIELENLSNFDFSFDGKEYKDSDIELCNIGIELEKIVEDLSHMPIDYELTDIINIGLDLCNLQDDLELMLKLDEHKIDSGIELLDSIENLMQVSNILHELSENLNYRLNLNSDIKELKEQLNIEGKSFECPIHGTIKILDNNCIPV